MILNIGLSAILCWNQNRQCSTENVSKDERRWIATSIEQMRPVVLGDKWGWRWKPKNFEMRGQNFSTSFKVLFWGVNVGIQSGSGWAKQNWRLSKMTKTVFSGIFGQSRLQCRGPKSIIHHQKSLYLQKFFDADREGRDEACSCGEIWILISKRKLKL